ncbi:MAG TPA: sulfur carrier protein ThiS [Gemmataceae bacterium]|nr:sulfur carrier protein ThiS [Gemmataceae bacterium]
MPRITINAESCAFPTPLTVADLLRHLGRDPKRLAVEVNEIVVRRDEQEQRALSDGDRVEIVTLVGGGETHEPPADKPLCVGPFTFRSRLFTGTGKYATYDLMRDSLAASGCEVTTVAVRRERLVDQQGRNLLDYLDLNRYTILPNTAGCFSADDAIRHARLARELLTNLGNPGADWVKLECLADKKTLLPDPIDTIRATEILVKEGFRVLVYTTDDPVLAKRLKGAGATSVMPAGSPIGSGQGVLNPNNIRIILEYLKEGDPDYPVIVDAGVGTASDVSAAMELGCDGVLLNTAIASAKDPVRMAWAMRYACDAGRLAYLAGRIPKKLYATASSPTEGQIARSQ